MKSTNKNYRTILMAKGKDTIPFLQSLLTNDINKINKKNAVYSALLSPQGKYLFDFFVYLYDEKVYIECNFEQINEIKNLLSKYILRKDIILHTKNDLISIPVFDKKISQDLSQANGVKKLEKYNKLLFYIDPRNIRMGARLVGERKEVNNFFVSNKLAYDIKDEYNKRRIELCIPEPIIDLEYNKSFILEYNFEQINGVSFSKGCYIGQENTARLKYRGNIKRSLKKVKLVKGNMPDIGSALYLNNNEVGIMKSSYENLGLALIKTQLFEKGARLKNQNSLLEVE